LSAETRRLVAILAADIAGYSRLMAADEQGTLARLKKIRTDSIEPTVTSFGGSVVGSAGDSLLVEFASVVKAVECAVNIQTALGLANAELADDKRMEFRIGVNLGDVIADGGTIYGDGVNIAARLEKLAEPGGVCISGSVYDQIKGKLPFACVDLGEQTMHNIPEPVRAYRVEQPYERPQSDALPLPDKPSIAVLPFQNMGGDKDQDYFSDGITEDIITGLSKLHWIFVIARNSTFAYKGKSPDIRAVGRELGVHYVLEGSVRKSGERLRINAQLIDATTGAHVWAERYDRAIADIFAVQDEITESVIGALEPQLYAAENRRFQKKAPESLDAWGCVMRAMPYVWTWAAADNEAGVKLLERACTIDPAYARATGLLGWTYAARAHLGVADPAEMLAKALSLAERAMDQDNNDAWAHLAAGYVHMVARQFQPAIDQLGEAIDRNPSFAIAHMVMGSTYGYGGMPEEGIRHVEMAMRLSPRDSIQSANLSTIGTCHFIAGRYAEAADYQRRAVQLRPHFGTAWRSLVAAAGLAGDLALAASALASASRLQPNLTLAWVEAHHPIVQPEDRARYVEGLRRAGLH
jgi:TolB-like protein/Tfp pilus assembly protein PilF